jgi:hypothetical protein
LQVRAQSVYTTSIRLRRLDRLYENDTDIIFAGLGRDRLNADDGDERDELYGKRGFDKCYVDATVEVENKNSSNALWVNGVRVR